jgi:uncharacterized phiE125 gp8 family phage protein
MTIKIITPVGEEPISIDDVKDQLRIDTADEDDYIADLIFAARDYAQGYTGRALATQTLELLLDRFPVCNSIFLPRPPLQSVVSVIYKTTDGTEKILVENIDFIVDDDLSPGRIALPHQKSWPSEVLYPVSPIRIRYVAGYNCTTSLIPYSLKAGMLLHVGLLYKYRDEEIPPGALNTVKRLYDMYRITWF